MSSEDLFEKNNASVLNTFGDGEGLMGDAWISQALDPSQPLQAFAGAIVTFHESLPFTASMLHLLSYTCLIFNS